jgi:hypothetical protein
MEGRQAASISAQSTGESTASVGAVIAKRHGSVADETPAKLNCSAAKVNAVQC